MADNPPPPPAGSNPPNAPSTSPFDLANTLSAAIISGTPSASTTNVIPPSPPAATQDPYAGMMEGPPPQMIRRIMYLQSLHDTEKKSVVESYTAERAELEAKYAKLYNDVYDKRLKVLQGECDKEIDEEFLKQDPTAEIDKEEEEKAPIKGCPQVSADERSDYGTVANLLTLLTLLTAPPLPVLGHGPVAVRAYFRDPDRGRRRRPRVPL